MSMIEDNKAFVRMWLDAVNRWDLQSIENMLADDVRWDLPYDSATCPLSGTVDKATVMGLYDQLGMLMPDGIVFKLGGMTAEDDRVAFEASSSATTPFGPFTNRYHFLFRFRDGKITEAREYADSAMVADFTRRAQATPDQPKNI